MKFNYYSILKILTLQFIVVGTTTGNEIYKEDFSTLEVPNLPQNWHHTSGTNAGSLDAILQSDASSGNPGEGLVMTIDSSNANTPDNHWWSVAMYVHQGSLPKNTVKATSLKMDLKSNKATSVIIKIISKNAEGKNAGEAKLKVDVGESFQTVGGSIANWQVSDDFNHSSSEFIINVVVHRGLITDGESQHQLYIDNVQWTAEGTTASPNAKASDSYL
ncbi:MAG: hypothetical protein AAF558_05395 [Verrucomicrobiota bacterium]